MFRRIRQLRISLAAKCQILFGAAVVMIIGSALFVPWHRMDDLMNQLNERAAFVLTQQARMSHLAQPDNAAIVRPPARFGDYQQPRLAGTNPAAANLTAFERHSIQYFLDHPDATVTDHLYVTATGQTRYRYATRLTNDKSCVACHASAGIDRFVGVASVDIVSQVDQNQLQLNRLFIFLAGLLAGSLAIGVFYLITTRLILQPVRVLQETAEKVSQGDLNIRSDINTGDEFQQLAETFNTMLANLKHNADQLQLLNKNLDLKLGQLAESNVALFESNRLKSEFLANVSHELRTPLNSILGFAEQLRDTLAAAGPACLESKPARYLQNILTSGRNLLQMINDLLDLAKIEAGRMDVRSEPLSLGDLFEALTTLLRPLTEAKSLTISVAVASDVPIIQTDSPKLQQVLYNFLSNAIKFSPPSGRVDLSASLENHSSVRITIADQGPGLAPEQQAVIFEKFRQVDGGVTRAHGGTGLGLAIAKELTGLIGGSIGVRSVPGEGAAFWIVLPLKIEPETKDVRAKMILT